MTMTMIVVTGIYDRREPRRDDRRDRRDSRDSRDRPRGSADRNWEPYDDHDEEEYWEFDYDYRGQGYEGPDHPGYQP